MAFSMVPGDHNIVSDVSEIQASSELVQALQKSKLLDDLYANEKTKKPLLEILKIQRPDLTIPEIDAPKAMKEAIQPEMETWRKEKAEMQTEMFKERMMRKHGLDDSGITEIAKLAQEKGISNFDTAVEHAKYVAASKPRNTQNSPLQMPDSQGLFADPRGWARREAERAIEDFKRGRLY